VVVVVLVVGLVVVVHGFQFLVVVVLVVVVGLVVGDHGCQFLVVGVVVVWVVVVVVVGVVVHVFQLESPASTELARARRIKAPLSMVGRRGWGMESDGGQG